MFCGLWIMHYNILLKLTYFGASDISKITENDVISIVFRQSLLFTSFSDICCDVFLNQHPKTVPTIYNMTYFGEKKFNFGLETYSGL